ncbi:uncharacterized protein LOC114852857 [Betta splendens]|uniref:Toll-like receptor n=1 Tax=Betta splendens TaxID=158456 RepID=A0A9W2XSG3_BETSP|nr:uncharacterized protein LOC114852857 [Betta splendens]
MHRSWFKWASQYLTHLEERFISNIRSCGLLLHNKHFSTLIVPGTGFTLTTCRISYNKALCVKRKLEAVPQDIPSSVTDFNLSQNKLLQIRRSDFSNVPLLTLLDLSRNYILRIDDETFARLVFLKRLNLNNNRLYKLRDDLFTGLSNLTELLINKNHIKTVSSATFKPLTSLTTLDISHNKLHHMVKVQTVLQHLPHLRKLFVKGNGFTTFHSQELTNTSLELSSLDLSQNPISVFRITADVFPELTWLSFGGSQQKRMKWEVSDQTFLRRVSTLDISGLQMASDEMKLLLQTVNTSLRTLRMNGMKQNLTALISISCSIPTVSSLQLRYNGLTSVTSQMFDRCLNVTELDLAQNRIHEIQDDAFRPLHSLRILNLGHNQLSSVPAATRNLPVLQELDLNTNKISQVGCDDFANQTKLRQLSLFKNSISALKECIFKDLTRLQVLKLHSNHLSKLNGAFKHYLTNLRQLHLNGNRLTGVKRGDFRGLVSLQNLSLHQNKIKLLERGCFSGLANLTDILLQMNSLKKEEVNKGAFQDLINLRRLDLRNNQIKYKNKAALQQPPFSQLSRLETLAMPTQSSRGRSHLPRNLLQGLTNLLVFNARNIKLLSLEDDMFTYTPQLQTLDISTNDLQDLSPELFFPLPNLKSLYISRTSLRSLDFLINANLSQLEFLQARRNQYSVIRREALDSVPALVYADLQGNSFTCNCDNAWFLNWVKTTKTQVFDGHNFVCNYPPPFKGKRLLDLGVQSCLIDTEFICFVATTFMILLFMLSALTYHFLRWQLVYAYYLFLALLVDRQQRKRQGPNQYDAFVSYNADDEPWVIGELLPKLEEEQGWKLCLHHRDFEPGKPIIDNITDAIYSSRKTICVISRKYLESEWCSREIQVASFRLFNEKKDVLILVFLEEIPTYELSPYYSMRKTLKKKTYLSWPRAGQHTGLFWEKLRRALQTREELGGDRLLLTVVDRQRSSAVYANILFLLLGPGVGADITMLTRGTKCWELRVVFLCLLNISAFLIPAAGFALRFCRISNEVAKCERSELTAVPKGIPSTVTGFDLSKNHISRIQRSDFKNLTVLVEIDLTNNNISQIDSGAFVGLTCLKDLNLNQNKLVELKDGLFDGLSKLVKLYIIRNHIKTVSSATFKPLTSLTTLDISHNKLHHMVKVQTVLQQLPHLRKLFVKGNGFTTFHSQELTNTSLELSSLDLSQNPISVFRITADVFPELTWLSFGGSQQKQMKWEVSDQTFLRRVSTLDISGLQMASDDMKSLIQTVNASLRTLRMNGMKQNLTALISISCSIPTLSSLQLWQNGLTSVTSQMFDRCLNVTELDLAQNRIHEIQDDAFRPLHRLRILSLSYNRFLSVPAAVRDLPALQVLELNNNRLKTLGCEDFAHQASAPSDCVFKYLPRLQVLKLETNHLSKLKGAFSKYLPNLQQLRLNANSLTALKHGEFGGLRSLQNLSLHDNQLGHFEKGCFIGLKNLTVLLLQKNQITEVELSKGIFNDLINLRRLDFRENHVRYNSSSQLHEPPFLNLTRLETLAIPSQHRREKAHLPSNFLQGLTNLQSFIMRNIQIIALENDMFTYTPRLQTLDISSNDLQNLSPELFSPLPNLKSLYISRTSLRSLDFLINANLTQLEFLQARRNQYSVISEETMGSRALPALLYLDLQGNSFSCDCDNAWFLNWTKNNTQTQVYDAYNFVCNYPSDLKGMKLLRLDVQSCLIDIEFICFMSTLCTVLVFMVASFTYHFLRWQLAYAYYLLLALVFDSKHKNKDSANEYDAFISYNAHHEPWVIGELLPKLEEEQGWKLCLHHRDFEPGKAIIDNITDAIYSSRKTICVISRRYLESEWCSREIQVASFRLFDERKDVLILVFLEEIPTYLLSPYYRMRKLLKKKTYLSWAQASEHTQVFWEKLHQALQTNQDLGGERLQVIVADRPWGK